jgi:predicted DNA-binding transcriptional regulator YafY
LKQKQIKITYKPFDKPIQEDIVNPQHLKQFNNRWFLFAYNTEYGCIFNYALDRIQNIEELGEAFAPLDINWMDYFWDIIGVTKPEEGQIEKIVLRFSEKRINYVLTKPLHPTQKPYKWDEDVEYRIVSIEVIPNNELYQLLLSFGSDLVVLSPESIRENMKEKIEQMRNNY